MGLALLLLQNGALLRAALVAQRSKMVAPACRAGGQRPPATRRRRGGVHRRLRAAWGKAAIALL
eukprot:1484510-Alexandrium_andersonii.AAC.1